MVCGLAPGVVASWGQPPCPSLPLWPRLEPATPTSSKGTLHHGCPVLGPWVRAPLTQSPSTWGQSGELAQSKMVCCVGGGGLRWEHEECCCTYDFFYLLGDVCWCLGAEGWAWDPERSSLVASARWSSTLGTPAVGLCEQFGPGLGGPMAGGVTTARGQDALQGGPRGRGHAPSGQTACVSPGALK